MSIVANEKVRFGLSLSFWALVLGIIFSQVLVRQEGGIYGACGNCYGDWSAHTGYTASFAYGENYPPELPILAGERFSYPFFMDLVSGLLTKAGVDWVAAMVIPSWLTSVGLVAAIMALGWKITNKIRVGILSVWLFMLSGGLGFWWWLKDGAKITNIASDYTHLPDLGIEWINMITSQLVPQRGLALGMSLSIGAYWLLWRYLRDKKANNLIMAGLIMSLLPLIHAHSFIAVVVVALSLGIWQTVEEKRKFKAIKPWLGLGVLVLVLGGLQVAYFYSGVAKASWVRVQLGWLNGKQAGGIIWFWLKNFGLVLPLAIVGWLWAPKTLKKFSFGFWILFAVSNLFIFQPNSWDNTKIFDHWYLMAVILAAVTLNRLMSYKRLLIKTVGVGFLIVSIWAGTLDVVRLIQQKNHKYRFWSSEQIKLAEWTKAKTEPRAVFLTASNHNHWLTPLTGRKIVLGYGGWLWTYGIDYQERETEVRQIYAGDNKAKELLTKYGVDYVVIGVDERQNIKVVNEEYFKNNLRLVYQQSEFQIYQTK